MLSLPRLYAILDLDLCRVRGLEPLNLLDLWLAAGVRLIQLRAKNLAAGPTLTLAATMAVTTRNAGALFLLNDRADVARLSAADGVHVGQEDLSPTDVRRLLPTPHIVGLSTHNAEQVQTAISEPVDYIAIGPVFETVSKNQPAPTIGIAGVRSAAALVSTVPLVAIGGITVARARAVVEGGATSVAIISDLLNGDPRDRVHQFLDVLA